MYSQYNPFKDNRAEQMRDLWKYYVPFPGLDGAGKPIVVEGGRGSGKTMFFQCNSWRQILSQIRKNEKATSSLFDDYEFIGIYYRVDTTFVSSMCSREEENWNSVFETYLSIYILQEVIELIENVREDMGIAKEDVEGFVSDFSKRFNPNSKSHTLLDFRHETDVFLDAIEDKINGFESRDSADLRWVKANRIIKDMCFAVNRMLKRDLLYKIFIDEYETLQEYQQKIINTLIKHSTLPVVFNIGLRLQGMKTNETISKTETIEAPHDYQIVKLGIDDIEDIEVYPGILKEICRKRIELGKEQKKIPESAPEDIEFYLGNYSFDYELERICRHSSLPHLKKLSELIQEMGKEEKLTAKQIEEYIYALCTKAPILNSRLHYAILCKKTQYTPTLREIYEAYSLNSRRYCDWMHNRKFGVLFLLCKEVKKEKMYYGFEVYAALSSNIVRYFLELCEQAFRIAFLSNYSWDSKISPEIQSEAARYVSEYKVVDIAGYEPYGKELRLFIQFLGQIFYKLHTAENNTLGEPEPNHFNTKDLSLPDHTRHLISSAIMWNVLQEGEPTKRKQSKLSPETVDYFINKIYVPYFGISYRNQRKILLDVNVLTNLLSGDEEKAKMGFRSYFKLKDDHPVTSDNPTHQMSLYDSGQGGDL